MLNVTDAVAGYGKIRVLNGVSFEVKEGELVSILGANGAGKTTLLRSISGLIPMWSGTIEFYGERIDRMPPDEIVKKGLVQVPEGRKLFPHMTVLENLELGAYTPEARKQKDKNLQEVFELFPILRERVKQAAGSMSGGQQQMLAIARAMMSSPKLLILDEPSIGLSPLLTQQMFDIVSEIKQRGVTVLLVEQNVQHALSLSDRGYVLENGRTVLQGTGNELLQNDHLRAAYLGI